MLVHFLYRMILFQLCGSRKYISYVTKHSTYFSSNVVYIKITYHLLFLISYVQSLPHSLPRLTENILHNGDAFAMRHDLSVVVPTTAYLIQGYFAIMLSLSVVCCVLCHTASSLITTFGCINRIAQAGHVTPCLNAIGRLSTGHRLAHTGSHKGFVLPIVVWDCNVGATVHPSRLTDDTIVSTPHCKMSAPLVGIAT
jgi:hypothetical protein